MLDAWQRVQYDVWEVDAEVRHLESSAKSALGKLRTRRQHHGELGHALRQLWQAGTASSPAVQAQGGAASSLEDVLGIQTAEAWTSFLLALARSPSAVPAIARAVGYQSYEFLAHFARTLFEDPLAYGIKGAESGTKSLDEIISFEFDTICPPRSQPQASALLADNSFLAALLQQLTARTPACMAWSQCVLKNAQVLDAVQQLIHPTREVSSASKLLPRAGITRVSSSPDAAGDGNRHAGKKRTVVKEVEMTGGSEDGSRRPSPSPAAPDEQRPSEAASGGRPQPAAAEEPAEDEQAAVMQAAAAVIFALADNAGRAPLVLCRLASALSRQLSARSPSASGVEADFSSSSTEHALLAGLILSNWLVPSLLGMFGHGSGIGPALHAEPMAHQKLMELAKLLKAIASDSGSTSDPEKGGGIVIWRYISRSGLQMHVRAEPSIRGPKTAHVLCAGDVFRVSEERVDDDGVRFLRLADGRGWVFDRLPATATAGSSTVCVRDESADGSRGPEAVRVAFVAAEAQKLRKGFFQILLTRGGRGCAESEDATWPQCLVCSTGDLATLSRGLSQTQAAAVVAVTAGVPSDVIEAVRDSPVLVSDPMSPHARRNTVAGGGSARSSTEWGPDGLYKTNSHGSTAASHRGPPSKQGSAQSIVSDERSPSLAVMWIASGKAPVVPSVQQDLRKLIDADDAAALSIVAGTRAGEEDGYDSPISTHDGGEDAEEASKPSNPSRRDASRPAWAMDSAQPTWAKARGSWAERREIGAAQLASFTGSLIGGSFLPEDRGEPDCAPELLWHILAEPQLIEGLPDASLLSALRARQAQGFGQTVQQQLRLEFLVEWLRGEMLVERVQGRTCERSAVGSKDAGRKSVEERLLTTFSRIVELRKETVASVRRNFLRLQVAQQLVSRHCEECLHALKHCSEHATKLKCQTYLQTLWPSDARKPQLELCILSPPAAPSGSAARPGQRKKTRWLNVFGAEPDNGRLRTPRRQRAQPGPADQQDGMQHFVEIFEVSQCRCHNVQSVGASLGVDNQRFEESVKHRTANGLKEMIQRLLQLPLELVLHGDPMDPLDVGGAIATFLEMLTTRLVSHCGPGRRSEARSSDASGPEGDDRARFVEALQVNDRGVQSIAAEFVFSHLHARLFPQTPTETDLRGLEWLAALEWIQPRHLDVPKELMDTAQVEQAIVTLRRLHKRRSPGDMLEALWHAFRNVTEAACLKAQMGPRLGRKDSAFGADDALPLFILVIIRANPPMLDSVLLYVDRFLTKEQGVTEQGYALTQVQLGVSFTASVRPDRLLALRPGEWERNMSRFQV